MNTTENNKLIAEFMGAVGTPLYNPEEYDVYITGILNVSSDDEEAQHFFKPNEMEFHTSWDWLMPCIKKIREIHNVELSVDQYDQSKEIVEMINPFDYNLEQVYKAVVEFIKWYNENK